MSESDIRVSGMIAHVAHSASKDARERADGARRKTRVNALMVRVEDARERADGVRRRRA
jgi:hypothetical protein